MGHDGGESASWTVGHPEKVKDWGLRAHYSVATAAKTLGDAFYDKPVSYSYFEGCSNGGRQAMMMAQNYPELFDGIVAGAPSNWYPDLLFWLLWTGKHQTPVPGAARRRQHGEARRRSRNACLRPATASTASSTGRSPIRAHAVFDIDTMGPCRRRDADGQELAVVKAMYAGTDQRKPDEQRYTGAKFGSEADWIPLFADNGGYGPFIEHFVYSLN